MSQSAIVRSCAVRPRPLPTGARSAAQVAPSLGLAWATCVTQRLFLSRCPAAAAVADDEDAGPGDGTRTGRTGRGCAPQPLLRSIQARRQAGLRHCCECPCVLRMLVCARESGHMSQPEAHRGHATPGRHECLAPLRMRMSLPGAPWQPACSLRSRLPAWHFLSQPVTVCVPCAGSLQPLPARRLPLLHGRAGRPARPTARRDCVGGAP